MKKNNNCFRASQEVKNNKNLYLYNLIARHGFSVKALLPLANVKAHKDLKRFLIKHGYITNDLTPLERLLSEFNNVPVQERLDSPVWRSLQKERFKQDGKKYDAIQDRLKN